MDSGVLGESPLFVVTIYTTSAPVIIAMATRGCPAHAKLMLEGYVERISLARRASSCRI